MGQLQDAIRRQQEELLAGEVAARERIADAYVQAEAGLASRISALQSELARTGELSPAKVFQLRRYQELERQLLVELQGIAGNTAGTLQDALSAAQQMAGGHATELIQATLYDANPQLAGGFANFAARPVQDVAAALQPDAPLGQLVNGISQGAVPDFQAAMVRGITRGLNPRTVANAIRQGLGISQSRAETIARTEMLRTYRTESIATYQANSDILDGWEWFATHSPRTCGVCLALDGKVFPLDDSFMPQHPNCRCRSIPSLRNKDWQQPRTTGAEYLAGLSEAEQNAVLGVKRATAWRNGEITLNDTYQITEDPVWGPSVRSVPAKELFPPEQ